MTSREWTGPPDKALPIPEEYVLGLKYEVLVLSSKKVFTFKCVDYSREGGIFAFKGVIIDTSHRNARGQLTEYRISYHDEIVLANVGFMLIPLPEPSASETPAD